MKDNRPTIITKDDLKAIAFVLLVILAAAVIDPLTDAIANFLTR